MAVATRLRRKLRSHPTFAKTTRRRGQRSGTPYIREYQKGLVVINYPGPSPPGVMKVFECDNIVDGSIHYSGDMTEDEIRQKVARIIRKKQLKEYKFKLGGFCVRQMLQEEFQMVTHLSMHVTLTLPTPKGPFISVFLGILESLR